MVAIGSMTFNGVPDEVTYLVRLAITFFVQLAVGIALQREEWSLGTLTPPGAATYTFGTIKQQGNCNRLALLED